MDADREEHIFRLQIGYAPGGAAKITVVSYDASIVYVMEANEYWINQFRSGERRIHVNGYFDLNDRNIYLGERVEGQDW